MTGWAALLLATLTGVLSVISIYQNKQQQEIQRENALLDLILSVRSLERVSISAKKLAESDLREEEHVWISTKGILEKEIETVRLRITTSAEQLQPIEIQLAEMAMNSADLLARTTPEFGPGISLSSERIANDAKSARTFLCTRVERPSDDRDYVCSDPEVPDY